MTICSLPFRQSVHQWETCPKTVMGDTIMSWIKKKKKKERSRLVIHKLFDPRKDSGVSGSVTAPGHMHPLAYGPTPIAGTQTPSHRHPLITFSASHNVSLMTPALTHCDGCHMWTHHNESVLEHSLDWVGWLPRCIKHFMGCRGRLLGDCSRLITGCSGKKQKCWRESWVRTRLGKHKDKEIKKASCV